MSVYMSYVVMLTCLHASHRKLKRFNVFNRHRTNIDNSSQDNTRYTMPFFLAEVFTMAGAFTVIFGIMICCIRNDTSNDAYSRQLRRLRKHKWKCNKCKR